MMYLGTAVKNSREAHDMSRRKLSAAAGLSPSYVARLERGEVEPSLKTFAAIASVLEWSESDIALTMKLHRSEGDSNGMVGRSS